MIHLKQDLFSSRKLEKKSCKKLPQRGDRNWERKTEMTQFTVHIFGLFFEQ